MLVRMYNLNTYQQIATGVIMQTTEKESFFELHKAVLSPSALIGCSAFTNYTWSELQGQVQPITMEEIEQAIKENKLIPPGTFVDHPEDDQLCNIDDCTRDQHIQRIAWFVQNYDHASSDLPSLGFSPFDEPDAALSIAGGNHRLCAMIYKGTPSATFEIRAGRKSIIEKHPAFIRWDSDIDHDLPFGSNIVSSGAASFEIQISDNSTPNDYRIWIHNCDNVHDPVTVARFRHSEGGFSSAEMHDYEGRSLFAKVCYPGQEAISLSQFFEHCAEWLHPLFSAPSMSVKLSEFITAR